MHYNIACSIGFPCLTKGVLHTIVIMVTYRHSLTNKFKLASKTDYMCYEFHEQW